MVTLRLLFHPVEAQGSTHVSGSSRSGSGPSGAQPLEDVESARVVGLHPALLPSRHAGTSTMPGHCSISAR